MALSCKVEDALIFMNVSKIYRALNRHASDLGYDTEDGLFDGFREAHEMLAKAYYHLKRYKEALVVLENASRLHFHDENMLYYYKGLVAVALEDYEHAAGFFQMTLKAKPGDPGAYYFLGLCLEKMGFKDAADALGWRYLPQGGGFETLGKQQDHVRIF
jgi:tetratricopeptide (TPR) repeat protein